MAKVIGFPSLPGSPQEWIKSNPDIFFVASEDQRRFCWFCRKAIPAGDRYYGAWDFRLSRGRVPKVIVSGKVRMRLHRQCVVEAEGAKVKK